MVSLDPFGALLRYTMNFASDDRLCAPPYGFFVAIRLCISVMCMCATPMGLVGAELK